MIFNIIARTGDGMEQLGTVSGGGYYEEGSEVTLTASASDTARFVGWSDGEQEAVRTFIPTADGEYIALFEERIYFTVDVVSNDAAFGEVTGAGVYEEGTEITITAIPNEGYQFSAWSDGILEASRTFTVTENIELRAIFTKVYNRTVNTYRYDGKVGRMKANGRIYSSITMYKTLNVDHNLCLELGQFDSVSGKHFIFISIKEPSKLILKQYILSLNHAHTSGDWVCAHPVDSSDLADTSFQLEVNSDGVSAAIRLKRLEGGEPEDFQIVIQNLGVEDESWFEGNASYVDNTPVVSYIESLPHGLNHYDHNNLMNRGSYSHSEIDSHINADNPHPGHELISSKNVANGYAGLDGEANVPLEHLPIGGDDDQLVLGSDPRLADDRYPKTHAFSHTSAGDDVLYLADLAGDLNQGRTHAISDVDGGVEAIHHTLGNNPFQAAPGDHNHDALYEPIGRGVEGGSNHIHDGENTPKVDHNNLLNIGTYSHTDIDAHINAENPHIGHELISNRNQPNGYAGLNALGKIRSSELDFGSGAGSVCEGNDPRLTDSRPPGPHASYHADGSSDPIDMGTLGGVADQSHTHGNPDTDSSALAIHHTLGTGANQAAAGNHDHTGVYAPASIKLADSVGLGPNLYIGEVAANTVLATSTIEEEVDDGEGGTLTVSSVVAKLRQLNHNELAGVGTHSHSDIDTFLDNASSLERIENKGIANGYASLDATGHIPVSQLPDSASQKTPTIATYTDMLALENVEDGTKYFVIDASADPSVDDGWAIYVYDGEYNSWTKIAEQESLDIITDWSNVQNRPSSTVYQIDDAVLKSHVQNTDAEIVTTHGVAITADAIKSHIDDSAPHSNHALKSDKGIANGYAELDSNAKLPASRLPATYTAPEASHAINADNANIANEASRLSSPFSINLIGDVVGGAVTDGINPANITTTITHSNAMAIYLMSDSEIKSIVS